MNKNHDSLKVEVNTSEIMLKVLFYLISHEFILVLTSCHLQLLCEFPMVRSVRLVYLKIQMLKM